MPWLARVTAAAALLLTQAMGQAIATEMAIHQAFCSLPLSEAPLLAGHLGLLYAATGQREPARMELSMALEMYRAMDMTFWLPQTEAALAQVEA
jgi:hypothetical protein